MNATRPLAIIVTMMLCSELIAESSDSVVTRRAETLTAIELLLPETNFAGPSSLVAAVDCAQAVLGCQVQRYEETGSERLMYCLGYAVSGQESLLRELFKNPGEDGEEELVKLAVKFLLVGGYHQSAISILSSSEYSKYKTAAIESSFLEAEIRKKDDVIRLLEPMIGEQRTRELRLLNENDVRRAVLARDFAKTCGAQWLLASPYDMSFVDPLVVFNEGDVNSSAAAVFRAIENGGGASLQAKRDLLGRRDYFGLIMRYKLQQYGCEDLMRQGLGGSKSRNEFRARYAVLVSCDLTSAAKTLSGLNEQFLSDAILQLSAFVQETMNDSEIVSFSKNIESDVIRLYFLASSLGI